MTECKSWGTLLCICDLPFVRSKVKAPQPHGMHVRREKIYIIMGIGQIFVMVQ